MCMTEKEIPSQPYCMCPKSASTLARVALSNLISPGQW